MSTVEIEEAVSELADQPFDGEIFPLAFLEAFGNKETTLKRLKGGTSNQSDLPAAFSSAVTSISKLARRAR